MTKTLIVLATLATLAGCGESAGTGKIKLTTYGESFIEKEIPAASGGTEGLVDGNRIVFSKFLVAFSALKIAHRDGSVAAELKGPRVFDLHPTGPHILTSFDSVDARRWDRVEVAIGPPGGQATAGNASASDVALINDKDYSIYVEGKGIKGSKAVAFRWGFATKTRYYHCEERSGGEGVVVPSGGSATIQFTIHGDHLFYDDLQSSDPSLRFEALAQADADQDGEVTLDELARVDLTSLPLGQYGTGGNGSVTNLRQFIVSLTRTLVHYQGEGHCQSSK